MIRIVRLFPAFVLGFLVICAGTAGLLAADTTAPAITLNGLNPGTVSLGGSLSDPGATALDDLDGVVTVTSSGAVDTTTAGSYTITYSAADSTGNTATAARTVNVVSTPVWAENFILPDGINGTVNAIAETTDAFFYGGSFNFVGNLRVNNVVRVDKATGVVSPLGTAAQNGTNGAVNALAVTGTDLYVGGSFTTVADSTAAPISARNVAKWSTSASTWAPLGSVTQNGASSNVNALAVMGADLYVGGAFSTVSSSSQNSISAKTLAKWSANTWTPLGSATQNGTNGSVNALAVMGTDLCVGGTFSGVSSSTQNNMSSPGVARWSTSSNKWFSSPVPFFGIPFIYALVVVGTDVYIGGSFFIPTNNVSGIVRWNPGANTWSALGSGGQNSVSGSIKAMTVMGTDVYVGGNLSVNSTGLYGLVRNLAKWSTSGNAWSVLGTTAQNGTDSPVSALAASGTDVHVGGYLMTMRSSTQTNLPVGGAAKWNTTTGSWSAAASVSGTYGNGVYGTVYATLDAGDVVYVGGSFTQAGSVAANNVACWVKATRTWAPLGTAIQNGVSGPVRALALKGNDLYVGGNFGVCADSSSSLIVATMLAKWNTLGSTWSPLGTAAQNGANDVVYAMAWMGTDLYVGGLFTSVADSTASSISANRVAKWSTTNNTWAPLGTATQNGASGDVDALAVMGTDVYVGGVFNTVADNTSVSISANRVAKWSTASSAWTPLGTATQNGTGSGTVYALVVMGTDIYVGGSFTTVADSSSASISAKRVAKWSTTNTAWAPLGTSTQNGLSTSSSSVYVLMVNGTEVYAGGSFTTVADSTSSSINANRVAKWSTTNNTWTSLGTATHNGAGNDVRALTVSGTGLFLGGSFTTASGGSQAVLPSAGLAVYSPVPVPNIVIEQPVGTVLTDGVSSIALGAVKPGTSSVPVIFTMRNTSTTTDLPLSSLTVDGVSASDFIATPPGSTTLAANGGSTTFSVTFTPGAVGSRTAVLRVVSAAPGVLNPFDIVLTGSGLSSQETWRQSFFGSTSNTGSAADTADPDHDGIPNLIEWGCNLKPNSAGALPIAASRNGANLEYTYTRSVSALGAGGVFTVEWSDDLSGASWSSTGVSEQVLSDDGAVQQVKAFVPAGNGNRRFVHLKVTAP